ncbi:DNA polymerase I, partial [Patescibacteria group bacterium]|nr:DNA polymerase I [Patescibacteria group bacterium]
IGYDAENHILYFYDGKMVYECAEKLFEKLSQKEIAAANLFFVNNTFLVFHAKPIFLLLARAGIAGLGRWRDFLLVEFLLDAGRKEFSFEKTIRRVLNKEVKTIAEALPLFAELDAQLAKELRENNLQSVYETIELPLTPILAQMETEGIICEKKTLASIGARVNKELDVLTQKIYQSVGREFNLNSPRQLGEALFVKLKIGGARIKKTKTGQFATAERELIKLKKSHPIIADILSYRELAKLKTTYIDALPALIGSDNRLHTTFNQVGTSTGRLASENPNLQNIPIRSELGREIRSAFVAEKGWKFLGFDYSQLELRIAASLSGDKKMIQAFQDGVDIHRLTASEINNMPIEQVTPELRQRAKTFNFGILYGMGPRSFSEGANISLDEAKAFQQEYFHDFSSLAEYLETTKEFARNNGFVQTAFGRRRYLPNIISPNIRDSAEAERMAINMPIQGTAADIIKFAMIKIDQWMREKGIGDSVRMLLQIHDELIFEVRENVVSEARAQIKKIMETVWQSSVHLRVDSFEGNNWAELK